MPATDVKRDWVPAVAIVLGGGALALGLYFYTKKPPGVSPADIIRARFTFDYLGGGGTYVIQVSFGRIYPFGIFDHVQGLTWEREIELPGPDKYVEDLDCELAMAIEPGSYDAEALIRTPEMDPFQYIIKFLTQEAINVREE